MPRTPPDVGALITSEKRDPRRYESRIRARTTARCAAMHRGGGFGGVFFFFCFWGGGGGGGVVSLVGNQRQGEPDRQRKLRDQARPSECRQRSSMEKKQ